jgi:hypothetical protein
MDRHLSCGSKEDTFEYIGEDRVVRLYNDCRRFPLRLEADFRDSVPTDEVEAALYAFVTRMRSTFGANFRPHIGASLQARIPQLAVKVVVFFSLRRVEVVFRKRSPKEQRRRVMEWLIQPENRSELAAS